MDAKYLRVFFEHDLLIGSYLMSIKRLNSNGSSRSLHTFMEHLQLKKNLHSMSHCLGLIGLGFYEKKINGLSSKNLLQYQMIKLARQFNDTN